MILQEYPIYFTARLTAISRWWFSRLAGALDNDRDAWGGFSALAQGTVPNQPGLVEEPTNRSQSLACRNHSADRY